MPKTAWYQKTKKEIFSSLRTNESGLSPEGAREKLSEYGPNQLQAKKKESPFVVFLKQFKSPLIYILIFAAVISLIIAKPTNAAVIFFVIFTNAIMGFIQESRAKRTMEALKELSAPRTKVMRSGEVVEISTKDIVPGDIILIESGTKISADARVIESVRLQVNEAALTGESQPVYKIVEPIKIETSLAERVNMVFAGTIVTSGRGKAVVVATGMHTEVGKIADIIQSTPEAKTPFQRRMESFGRLIIVIVLLQIVAAFTVGHFIRHLPFYEIFMVALSQMVSSIPEGLPVAVTVALAVGIIGLFAYEILQGQSLIYARSVAFTTLAVTQWINGINRRSDKKSIFRMPFFGNGYLVLGLLVAISLHIAVLYIPFFQNLFSTIPLTFFDWIRIVIVASSVFWAEEIRKFVVRHKEYNKHRYA